MESLNEASTCDKSTLGKKDRLKSPDDGRDGGSGAAGRRSCGPSPSNSLFFEGSSEKIKNYISENRYSISFFDFDVKILTVLKNETVY